MKRGSWLAGRASLFLGDSTWVMKTFYWLDGPYEGLKVRRLDRFGPIVFDQVINDGAPYWFVTIRGFEPERDQPILRELFGQKWGNGTRRFVSMADVHDYLERLETVPLYQELEQKRLALENWRREQALNRLMPLGTGKNPVVKKNNPLRMME